MATSTTTSSNSEPSEIARVFGALTFYIFSCSCLHRTRPRSDSITKSHLKQTAHIWREEILNDPKRAMSPYAIPQTPNGADESYFFPVEPACMISSQPSPHSTMSPTLTERLPNPQPPVVSAADNRGADWMTLPPPAAVEIREMNRVINRQRKLSWSVASRSRSGSGSVMGESLSVMGVISGERPGSAGTMKSTPSFIFLPLEVENMVYPAIGGRRARFEEGVLDDMEGPLKPFITKPTEAVGGSRGRRKAKQLQVVTKEMEVNEKEMGGEMVQVPQRVKLSPAA